MFRGEWDGETVEVAHSLEWPGDPEVIRCDRWANDKRQDAVDWFLALIFDSADVIESAPRTDYAETLFNMIKMEEKQVDGQVTLF